MGGMILAFLQAVPLKTWLIIIGLTLLLLIFANQLYRRDLAERQLELEKRERERLEQKTEGLKILINTANIAQEVANEKKKANAQSGNSANANANYANARRVDSSQGSNDFNTARQRFCAEYPNDSLCR